MSVPSSPGKGFGLVFSALQRSKLSPNMSKEIPPPPIFQMIAKEENDTLRKSPYGITRVRECHRKKHDFVPNPSALLEQYRIRSLKPNKMPLQIEFSRSDINPFVEIAPQQGSSDRHAFWTCQDPPKQGCLWYLFYHVTFLDAFDSKVLPPL